MMAPSAGTVFGLGNTSQNSRKQLETGMFNRFDVFTTMLCAAVMSVTPNLQAQKSDVKCIVLVHGAWADGSGWRGVYDILVKDGYKVSIAQEPETSFKHDVAATKRVLAVQ